VLVAAMGFATMAAMIKLVSPILPNPMVVFARNLFALIALLPWIRFHHHGLSLRTGCFRYHLIRSVSGLAAMYLFFYTIGHMHLGEAVLLGFTSPLFIPLIAWIWIKEPLSARIWGAVGVGFAGVVLIMRPASGMFQPVALLGLMAGAFAAIAMVSIRRMSASEPAVRIVFYFSLLSTVISAIPALSNWQQPSTDMLATLALIGMLAAWSQLMLTKAYSFAPAAQVGVFGYSNVVFSSLIGWMFWEERLYLTTIIGAVLIALAGVMTSFAARKRHPIR
jgi:drug/metabolite transporter (DMT)-like permease